MISGNPSRTTLLGRHAEMRTLNACLERALAGTRAIALVQGAAGMGKTRLLDEAVDAAERLGLLWVRAVCAEGLVRPFGPLLDALATAGHPVAAAPAGAGQGGAGLSEYRLVEEICDRLERLTAAGALLLAVDDLHWADASTLTTLRSVARRLAVRPFALVVAVRPEATGRVSDALDDLVHLGADQVPLGPLDEGDAVVLVRELAGGREPGTGLAALLRGAAGNPLYLVELTRSLLEEGVLGDGDGTAEVAADGLPATFRAVVARRLRTLAPRTRQMIEAGAISGLSFDPGELAVILGWSGFNLAAAVEEALRAGILEDAGDRLNFTHALVRQAIYEDIPRSLRRQLHREAATALGARGIPAERVAVHVIAGAERGDRAAVAWLRDAAARTEHRAPGTAADLLDRAREIVSPTAPERDGLLADLAMAWATTGRLHDAEILATEVLRRRADPVVMGRLRAGMVYALTWQGRPGRAVLESLQAEGELPEEQRILLKAEGAVAQILTGDAAGARDRIEASLRAAREAGHAGALCHALCASTRERMLSGHLAAACERGREAVRLAEENPALAPAQPWFFLGLAYTIADRTDEGEAVLRRGREVAEDLGLVWALPLHTSYLANVYWLTGRWDSALAEDEAARAITEEFGMHLSIILASASRLARIALHRSEPDVAEEVLAEAEGWLATEGRQGGDVLVLAARGLLLEARGELQAAAELFGRAWQRNLDSGVASEVRLLGPDLVRLLLATGQSERASVVVPQAEEMARRVATPSAEGAGLRCRGLLMGDPDVMMAAAAAYRRSPRVVECAQTCGEAAVALARAGRKRPAADLLEEAGQIFSGLEASRDLARLQGVARRFGLRPVARQVRPSTGWGSLTDSERRVADLVATGSTNREVAAALVLSTHTVDSHLRHIFAKLGITSRVQLAAMASTQRRRA